MNSISISFKIVQSFINSRIQSLLILKVNNKSYKNRFIKK